MKISAAFIAYQNNYMRTRHMSMWTMQNYETCQRLAVSFFNKDIEDITVSDVGHWYLEMLKTKSNNTARNYVCELRVVLRYCRTLGLDVIDYDSIPTPKRDERVPAYCTPAEVRQMIMATNNTRSKALISLLYASGIRLGELISLNRDDVQDGSFAVVATKTNSIRQCYIDERTAKLLSKYLADRDDSDPALFVSYKTKKRISRTNVQFIVKHAAEKAGISKHVTPHTLRHSCLTDLYKNGADIRTVKEIAGHKNIQTTTIYTHLASPDLWKTYQKCHSI